VGFHYHDCEEPLKHGPGVMADILSFVPAISIIGGDH
jgi:hypothetical protein